jgi:imidazolonepropionase-like amidohydrolase
MFQRHRAVSGFSRTRLIACAAILALRVAAAQPSGTPVALVGATIYPSPEAARISNGIVVVVNGRISAVGDPASVKVPPDAASIDCSGSFVTAGFQNSHVHFTEPKWEDAASQSASTLAAKLEVMLTRYGFTTAVDTGSLLPNTTALRRRIESGELPGPRILTAGSPLYPPNGIPFYLKDGSIPPELLTLLPQPATPAEAVRAVAADVDGGADIIKLFTGSWVAHDRVLPMPIDVAAAAAAEAHRRGRLVFAHASNVAGLEVALAARVDVVAHAIEDTRGFTSDHLRRMNQAHMALVPTLTLFGDDDNVQEIFAEVRDYARAGGDLLFGTDVGFHQMYDPTREYGLLARAGLTWQEVLASLTTTPARRFGESERRGRIAPGMDADLVVLARDPASDIRAFADVRRTIRRGRSIAAPRVLP